MQKYSLGSEVVGGEMADLLEKALAAGHELNLQNYDVTKDERQVLCLFRTYRSENVSGTNVMSARDRVEGDIVLGPVWGDKPDTIGLRSSRWVYNPLRRDGTPDGCVLHTSPTIVGMNRIKMECLGCGRTFKIFKDLVIRNSTHPSGRQVSNWSDNLITPCPECQSTNLVKRYLRGISNETGESEDPVLTTSGRLGYVREQMIEELQDCWAAGPAKGHVVQLPKLWAVYAQGTCPDASWVPEGPDVKLRDWARDEYQTVASGVARQFPLALLPYGKAKDYHKGPKPISGASVDFWLEAPRYDVGWVQVKNLNPGEELGFKRQLWR